MNITNWLYLLTVVLILMLVIAMAITALVIIIRFTKKKSIRVRIITFISIIFSFAVIAGIITFNNYQKDKWFYDLKSRIKKEYVIVKKADFNRGPKDLSLFIYCGKNSNVHDFEPIFVTIKNYLFKDPSGSNPSQQSYLKRNQGKYTSIYIYFYSNEKYLYYSSYYTDGLQEKVDNFSTWYIEQNGELMQADIN